MALIAKHKNLKSYKIKRGLRKAEDAVSDMLHRAEGKMEDGVDQAKESWREAHDTVC